VAKVYPSSAISLMFFNRTTTAPKCIYIEGGVIKTSDGACGATMNAGTAATIETAPAPTVALVVATSTPATTDSTSSPQATTTPDIIPIATSTPVIETTPEPVIVSTTTPETATTTP